MSRTVSTPSSAPSETVRELTAEELALVAGGALPRGGWAASALPRGGWAATTDSALPRGGWADTAGALPRGGWA